MLWEGRRICERPKRTKERGAKEGGRCGRSEKIECGSRDHSSASQGRGESTFGSTLEHTTCLRTNNAQIPPSASTRRDAIERDRTRSSHALNNLPKFRKYSNNNIQIQLSYFPSYPDVSHRLRFALSFQPGSERAGRPTELRLSPRPLLCKLALTSRGSTSPTRPSLGSRVDPSAVPGSQPCFIRRRCPIFEAGNGIGG